MILYLGVSSSVQALIELLSASGLSVTKFLSLNNQSCLARPKILDKRL